MSVPKKVRVNIPAGVDDDQTIAPRGQGNAGATEAPPEI